MRKRELPLSKDINEWPAVKEFQLIDVMKNFALTVIAVTTAGGFFND